MDHPGQSSPVGKSPAKANTCVFFVLFMRNLVRQAWGFFIGCSTLGSFMICVSEVSAKKTKTSK